MNDKIVIFDLFDTLLTKVWFDYDKGLHILPIHILTANEKNSSFMQRNTENASCLNAMKRR